MWVAGIDGCKGGWVAFTADLESQTTEVELVDVAGLLKERSPDLSHICIDIPIGLLDGSRACDKAARRLLGQPRGSSVFAAPCRACLGETCHADGSATNLRITGRGLSQQAWGIISKIKQVDDAITSECQEWVFEVHPEVSFWALAGGRPMRHGKKTASGVSERLDLLRDVFPEIERHLLKRPSGVGVDDLLDAAAASWTALRLAKDEARRVCEPERDGKGLEVAIRY